MTKLFASFVTATLPLFCTFAQEPAAEIRSLSFQRFGQPVNWSAEMTQFPGVNAAAPSGGTLKLFKAGPIESLHPYDYKDSIQMNRPPQLDDLTYESLLLVDPVGGTEAKYPLLARAIRHPADFSFVVFEIDPAARFANGDKISAKDLEVSYQTLVDNHAATGTALKARVQHMSIQENAGVTELRFDLNVKDQSARDTIMVLSQMKVIRFEAQGNLAVPLATGPYQITAVKDSLVMLQKNPHYWGKGIPSRRGFFNFAQVEIKAFADPGAAPQAYLAREVQLYVEPRLAQAEHVNANVLRKFGSSQMRTEQIRPAGNPMRGYAFNMDRPALKDLRVRRALALLFDFENINRSFYADSLHQPTSLLEHSSLAPQGVPTEGVQAVIDSCKLELPRFAPFESYGVIAARQYPTQRARLRAAMTLLNEAGYVIEKGRLGKKVGDRFQPLRLIAVIYDNTEERLMLSYRNDIQRLGISLDVVKPIDGEAYHRILSSNDYDIATADDFILTKDAWPRVGLINYLYSSAMADPTALYSSNPSRVRMECVDNIIGTMLGADPKSPTSTDAVQALARLQQMLAWGFFVGDVKSTQVFVAEGLEVPKGLSAQQIHLYGWATP